ncbi:hypothetical protein H0E87_028843 [Populus deltoides]|uniref:Uncharacterized protein n=1 Tax=Populus deltoides TaxID=3696 RepID=A0A8T2WTC9_POPDE|nr:hypothetical protein H0E87_028843 [Populus deltoides]
MILITFANAKGVALTNGIDTYQVIGSRFISVNSGGSDSEDDCDSAVGGSFGESGRESDDLGWDSASSWSTGLTKDHFDGVASIEDRIHELEAENKKSEAILKGRDRRIDELSVLMKQIREPGARGSYLKDSENIMRQRVQAILWLKEIEEKEEEKRGHPLDVSTKLLLDNFPEGDKAKDFAESNSSGVKYSVQAKVPATCVGKRGQLLPCKPDFKVMPEGCCGTIKDLDGVHYEISKEDEMLYQEYVQKMNFNKMKIRVRTRSDVLWPLGMKLEMKVTLTREGETLDSLVLLTKQISGTACYFDSSKLITDANGISIGVSFKDWHRQSIGFIPFHYPDDIWFSFVQMAGQVKFHKYSSGVLLRVGSSQWRNWGEKGGVVVVAGSL